MYKRFFKRALDIILSGCALVILSPFLLVFSITGAIAMGGNPFFFQERPGKDGKIFKLIKFRSMSNKKDKDGNLLPDSVRLNSYGKLIRKLSIDELPELINIFKGDMSIVGPRPLAVIYLPYYNEVEKHRHDVRPGLTGLAQVNGRNALNWPDRFAFDVEYVNNITFLNDMKIIFKTVGKVLKSRDISVRGTTQIVDFHKFRMAEWEQEKKMVLQSEDLKVSIRSIKAEDAKTLMEMNNNDQIAKFVVGTPKKVTIDEQMKWMERLSSEKTTKRFMVDYEDKPVGTIIVSDINEYNRTANVNIKLLPESWGKGVGTFAIKLILEYCFYEMDMECITAHVLSYNEASLALFEKSGFVREGILRSRVIKDDTRYDLISFSILKDEYKK